MLEQPAADAEPAGRLGDPHPLDVGHLARVVLHGAAPDGLPAQVHHHERADRPPHLVRLGRRALARVEPAVGRPPVQLGHVGAQAALGVRLLRVCAPNLDHRRGDQPLDRPHRLRELGALSVAKRCEDRHRELVAPLVQDRSLGEPPLGEPSDPHPPVGVAGRHRHEPVRLERPEHPAQLPGVHTQPRAEHHHLAALGADLPQQPRHRERTGARQEVVAQRTDPLSDRPVEAAHLSDLRFHSLILVRDQGSDPFRRVVEGLSALRATPSAGGRGRPGSPSGRAACSPRGRRGGGPRRGDRSSRGTGPGRSARSR